MAQLSKTRSNTKLWLNKPSQQNPKIIEPIDKIFKQGFYTFCAQEKVVRNHKAFKVLRKQWFLLVALQ